jgi:hypothetical protein
MRTFIERGGHFDAAQGCHDERVDCAWMAASMMRLLSRMALRDGVKKRKSSGFRNWQNRNTPDTPGGYVEVRL